MADLDSLSYPLTVSPGSGISVGRFSSSHSSFVPGSSSTSARARLAAEGSLPRKTADIMANMSVRESRADMPSDISSVTEDPPRASDSRSLTAARMSPSAFSTMASMAAGSTSMPSASAILYRALDTVDAWGLLNVICSVLDLTVGLFLVRP